MEQGLRRRVRSETFADHYSQARQFFFSQTRPEQDHIVAALIFELSKVETRSVRVRMLGRLANIDGSICERVAAGLGYREPIEAIDPGIPARTDLKPSPALSILAKAKKTVRGRRIGCLVSEDADGALVKALQAAVTSKGGQFS